METTKLRFRHVYMGIGTFLVVLLALLTDPDTGVIKDLPFGAGTVATIIILLKSVMYVAVLHLSRKAMIDYLDLEEAWDKAKTTSEGSGLAMISVAVTTLAIAIVIYAATH